MWTPYTHSIAEMAETIRSVKSTKLEVIDWVTVKRFAKRLDALESQMQSLQRINDRCEEQMKRTALFKEELVANVFHPRNVERWIAQNMFDMMFGY